MAKTELRIKEISKQKGIKLSALAKHLQVQPASLSQSLARGNYNIERLQEIADFFGVQIWELFTESTEKGKLIALIYGDQLFRASTLEELETIVQDLKNKRNE